MKRQQQISGGIAGISEAIVYYRPVQSKKQAVEPEKQTIQSSSELEDVGELLDYIRRRKLRYPLPLSDSSMDEMPSDRTSKILTADLEDRDVTDLLSLFCGSLEGRQKEENKYAMLIYFDNGFLLAHVRAERGMSLKEDEGKIELIRRFLDIDNILSAALFEIEDEIKFSHFTDTGSDAFREFLGVRKQQYHYRKKNVQIICYYQGNRGLVCKFEFTNEEIESLWIQDHTIELSGSKFTIDGERSHEVKEIRWGNETYDSIESFKSDFKGYIYGLEGEQNRYKKLHQIPSDSDVSVYDSTKSAVDHRHYVELKGENGGSEIINKGNLPDNIHSIYANTWWCRKVL